MPRLSVVGWRFRMLRKHIIYLLPTRSYYYLQEKRISGALHPLIRAGKSRCTRECCALRKCGFLAANRAFLSRFCGWVGRWGGLERMAGFLISFF